MLPDFLICGLEHSGTTLVSELFRQVPGVGSGFECGVLLCDTPAAFRDLQPFAGHMESGWGVTAAELSRCCDAPDFAAFYARLRSVSRKVGPETRVLFDKTPRYLSDLTAVLRRAGPVPVLVTVKDPRAIVASDFRRSGAAGFDDWYAEYLGPKRHYLRTCLAEYRATVDLPHVHALSLEGLAMNARAEMEAMFAHVGQSFRLDYAVVDRPGYANMRGSSVSADVVFAYRRLLEPDQIARVEDDFAEFPEWFYR